MIRWNWRGILLSLILLTVWEIAARLGLVPPRLVPPPSLILERSWELALSGDLARDLGHTLARMGTGLGLAAVTMIPLGIGAGRSERFWLVMAPTVESLRSLPPALVIFPAMLLLGIGDAMKVFAVFFACAFPLLLSAMDAVRALPSLFLDTARTFGTSRFETLRQVIVPAAAPGIFSAFKTALPMAFIVAIIAEIIGSTDGIGHFLMRSQRLFDITGMYAATLATALTGGLLALGLNLIESTCLIWYAGWKRIAPRGTH
jgi:ABC-type nitrate/sulfonate/bicarbonate transport system permease component